MADAAVSQLIILLDTAFADDEEHSLLANLRNVGPHEWRNRVPSAERTIRAITYHTGVAKYLYGNHLLGDSSKTYESVLRTAPSTGDASEKDVVVRWLREGHREFVDGVRTLTDADLVVPAPTHWGEIRPKAGHIYALIVHDTYHAGEINHLRALLQDNDKWPGY
ncbi:MAG TPA: DinB family protein [Dehalococcoidia bacterium]